MIRHRAAETQRVEVDQKRRDLAFVAIEYSLETSVSPRFIGFLEFLLGRRSSDLANPFHREL
jgi:hypothetical protein